MLTMAQSHKILVVDDSAAVRREVANALLEFEIIEAADGVEAVDQVRANPDVGLMICDVNMPRMSGIDVLLHIQDRTRAGLNVVMLTTEGQPALIRRARELGAKGWIVKPFKPVQLLAAARKLLGCDAASTPAA